MSGARTEIEVSLPGRLFSLPPLTREGRRGCRAWMLPVVEDSSGVSEFLRLAVEVRGRFWPAADLGCFWALEAGALDFGGFLGAASAGHSTSWVRSRRSGGIHSEMYISMNVKVNGLDGFFGTVKTLVELLVMDTSQMSEIPQPSSVGGGERTSIRSSPFSPGDQ